METIWNAPRPIIQFSCLEVSPILGSMFLYSLSPPKVWMIKVKKTKTFAIISSVLIFVCLFVYNDAQRTRLGDVAAFENRQPVTEAKFINKSSSFILLLGFIRRLD